MSFSFALSESRHLFLRSLSVRSLASAVSEPRQFFVACEDCTARFALSLLWRQDNRVSSASALSEARRIFLRYLVHCIRMLQFYARVVVKLELRYVQRPLYIYPYTYRKIAARCTTRLARSRSPIIYICSTLRRRIKGAASTINAIIRQPCYIFPVVGSYSTVASTVFARSLSGQLEDLVSQRSDCL